MKEPRLEWYIAVVEAGGISKAAGKLFVSQQSLSAYIKRLETHYSILLFNRSQGFSVTPQGRVLYEYAKKIMIREQRLLEEYRAIREGSAGRVRFGLSVARSQSLLPKVIPLFREQYPNVKTPITEAPTATLVKLLAQRKIDIYYGKDFDAPSGVEKETLLQERLYFVVTDKLLRQVCGTDVKETVERFGKGVWLKELSAFPFVGIDSTGKIDRPIDAYCRKFGIMLNNALQANNTPLQIELCMRSLGAGLCLTAFLPQVIQFGLEDPANRLNVFPVQDDIADWRTVLAYYPDRQEPAYTACFKSLIRSYALPEKRDISPL